MLPSLQKTQNFDCSLKIFIQEILDFLGKICCQNCMNKFILFQFYLVISQIMHWKKISVYIVNIAYLEYKLRLPN